MMPFIKEYETISMDRRKYAHPWPIGLEREARTGVFVVPNELNRKKKYKIYVDVWFVSSNND